jgi:hypothetical protein
MLEYHFRSAGRIEISQADGATKRVICTATDETGFSCHLHSHG